MSGTVGAAVFDYPTWALRYPELAGSVSAALAGLYWTEAGLYLDPSASSVVADIGQRGMILNMITAHIAMLNAPINGQGPTPLVGRMSNAAEGSVSTAVAMDAMPGSAQWFLQTRYGIAAWQALAPYRTARYVPGPNARPANFFGPGTSWPFGPIGPFHT